MGVTERRGERTTHLSDPTTICWIGHYRQTRANSITRPKRQLEAASLTTKVYRCHHRHRIDPLSTLYQHLPANRSLKGTRNQKTNPLKRFMKQGYLPLKFAT